MNRLAGAFCYVASLLLATGLLLLVAEGVARLWPVAPADHSPASAQLSQRAKSTAYDGYDWKAQYFADQADYRKITNRYAPYSLWKNGDWRSQTINVIDGYRVTWTPPERPDSDEVHLWVFGGSTTFCAEGPDDVTIPSLLAKRLAEAAGPHRYIVHNYAASGFLSNNEVHLLVELLNRGKRPDMVLFYDGVNDTVNKVSRGIPHYRFDYFDRFGRPQKGDPNRDLLRKVAHKFRLVQRLSPPAKRPPSLYTSIVDETVLADNAREMLQVYTQNVQLVQKLGAAYGFKTLFFWQPDLFSPGKVLTREEQAIKAEHADKEQLAFDVVAWQIQTSRPFAGLGVVNLSQALAPVESTIFLDFAHITARGNQVIAERMAEVVAESNAETVAETL